MSISLTNATGQSVLARGSNTSCENSQPIPPGSSRALVAQIIGDILQEGGKLGLGVDSPITLNGKDTTIGAVLAALLESNALTSKNGGLFLTVSLPQEDPQEEGQLWLNGGLLAVSNGK